MASIGSVRIQRPIKLGSRGEGVLGRDSGCQYCLYTYLSILTQTGLNMNTLEAFPPPPFFLTYLSFTKSIQLSLCPSATSQNAVTHFSLVFLLSSSCLRLTRFVHFAQYPHVSSLAFSFTCCYLQSSSP